jgi:hypothetical protein
MSLSRRLAHISRRLAFVPYSRACGPTLLIGKTFLCRNARHLSNLEAFHNLDQQQVSLWAENAS